MGLTAAWLTLDPAHASEALDGYRGRWWIAGGWAIDLFGGSEPRPHKDVDMGTERDGLPVLAPEIALLFKAKPPDATDERDFAHALPLLDGRARRWLSAALDLVHPAHPWQGRLA